MDQSAPRQDSPTPQTAAPEHETGAALADLLASLVAIGRSMQEEFDPQRFLDEFSDQLQRLILHDRLVIDLVDEECRTFTVFAEHACQALRLHQNFYTIAFEPRARYLVSEWVMRPVFAGETMRVDDFRADSRFAVLNPHERKLVETGIRSGLLVPMESGGHVIGALVTTSLADHAYGEQHLTVLRQVATLIDRKSVV